MTMTARDLIAFVMPGLATRVLVDGEVVLWIDYMIAEGFIEQDSQSAIGYVLTDVGLAAVIARGWMQ